MSRKLGSSTISAALVYLNVAEQLAARPIRIAPTSKAKRSKGSPRDSRDVGAGEAIANETAQGPIDDQSHGKGPLRATEVNVPSGHIESARASVQVGQIAAPDYARRAHSTKPSRPVTKRHAPERHARPADDAEADDGPWRHAPEVRKRIANYAAVMNPTSHRGSK